MISLAPFFFPCDTLNPVDSFGVKCPGSLLRGDEAQQVTFLHEKNAKS